MRFKFVLAFVLSMLVVSCNENTITPVTYGSISGVVLAPDGKTPVQGASVQTNPATSAIATDSAGAFTLTNITSGSYTVTASKNGYASSSVSVNVTSGKTVQAVIFLSSSAGAAPAAPTNPAPTDQASGVPLSVTLSWHNPSQSQGIADTTRYDVYMYKSGSDVPSLVASNITDTNTTVSGLKVNTTYFWQVSAWTTSDTNISNSNIWSFTTISVPNNDIAFAREVNGNYQVFTCDTAGNNAIQLTDDNSRDWWPRFNPLHNIVAYTSDEYVEPQIFTMNLDGSNVFQVTTTGVSGYGNYGIGFSWSPDGASLLYAHNDRLYSVNADGSGLKLIATAPAGTNFSECSYSPQGNRIVALVVGPNVYGGEIYTMNSDGSNMALLVTASPGMTADPSFSPDGQSVLYTHDISGYEDSTGREMDADIFEINLSTRQSVNLSVNTSYAGDNKPAGTNDLNPRYSPNGAYIIFENGSNTPNSTKNIWMMNSDANGSNDNSRHEIVSNGVMPDWK